MVERPGTETTRGAQGDYATILRTVGALVLSLGGLIVTVGLLMALYLVYLWITRDPHPIYRNQYQSPEESITEAADNLRVIFGLGFAVVAAGALIRGRRIGPAATVVMAIAAEIVSLFGGSAAFETWGNWIFGGALVPIGTLFDSWMVRLGAAIAIVLGFAAWTEQRPFLLGRVVGVPKKPSLAVIAVVIAACTQVVRSTASPPTPLEVGKQHLQRQAECVDKDDLRTRCGEVAALALDAKGARLVEVHRRYPTRDIMASVWDVASERRVWETIVTHTSDRSGRALRRRLLARREANRRSRSTRRSPPRRRHGQIIRPIDPCGGATAYLVFAFTPDGQSLAVGGDGVCLESLATGAIERKVPTAAEATGQAVLAIAFSSDAIWIGSRRKRRTLEPDDARAHACHRRPGRVAHRLTRRAPRLRTERGCHHPLGMGREQRLSTRRDEDLRSSSDSNDPERASGRARRRRARCRSGQYGFPA